MKCSTAMQVMEGSGVKIARQTWADNGDDRFLVHMGQHARAASGPVTAFVDEGSVIRYEDHILCFYPPKLAGDPHVCLPGYTLTETDKTADDWIVVD